MLACHKAKQNSVQQNSLQSTQDEEAFDTFDGPIFYWNSDIKR